MMYGYPSLPKVCGSCGGQATRTIRNGATTHGYSCVKCYDKMLDALNLGNTPHETQTISPKSKSWLDAQVALKTEQALAVAEAERIILEAWSERNPEQGMCPPEPAP